jgi:hypothetical protein
MLERQSNPRSAGPAAALIVVWSATNHVQCVLAPLDSALELRLEVGDNVFRRGRYLDIRQACEVARRWRADWDYRDELGPRLRVPVPCPECGDDGIWERDVASGAWLRCRSCGEVWVVDDGSQEGRRSQS